VLHEILTEIIRKHLYIIYFEKFKHETSEYYIERYVAKHPDLKPELIVVNDQLHGFKRVSEQVKTLENFPIYIEIEYGEVETVGSVVEQIELYSEAMVSFQVQRPEIKALVADYQKSVAIDSVNTVMGTESASIVIYSTIDQLVDAEGAEATETTTSAEELRLMTEASVVSFCSFIKSLNDIVMPKAA